MALRSLDIVNNIPIIGHLKGIIQRLCGDEEAADRAISEANRTTAVLFAGAAGFFLAGVPLAVLLGATTGAEWDLGTIIPSNGERIQGICKIVEDPANVNSWIDATFDVTTDGLTGAYGGKIVQAAEKVMTGPEKSKSVQQSGTATDEPSSSKI